MRDDGGDRADMLRLKAGDQAALDDLMKRHAPKLFNYLLRCLQNDDDAADAAQETFVRVYQHCMSFRADSNFSSWLYTIATNLVKDRYRYRMRHPQVSLDTERSESGEGMHESLLENKTTPVDSMLASERGEAVRKAIGQLPEELRVPLILSEYEEKSHAEIGEILKCSAKAVETRLYRARKQLREQLHWLMEI